MRDNNIVKGLLRASLFFVLSFSFTMVSPITHQQLTSQRGETANTNSKVLSVSTVEVENYWWIWYVARTGQIVYAGRPFSPLFLPELEEEFLRLRRWGLAFHVIDNKNYGPQWKHVKLVTVYLDSPGFNEDYTAIPIPLDKKHQLRDKGEIDYDYLIAHRDELQPENWAPDSAYGLLFLTFGENYIFDLAKGKVRERTPEDPRVELHEIITYDLTTGEILGGRGEKNLLALLGHGASTENGMFGPARGIHLMDGYDVDIWQADPATLHYIFDLKEWKVRGTTSAEKEMLSEKWEREAKEALRKGQAKILPVEIEPLPDNRIRAVFQWSIHTMYVETNSSVLGVRFDSINRQISIEVSGVSGTKGELNLFVPIELVPLPTDVKIYLDGSPIDFKLTQAENHYSIYVGYTHSLRILTINLIALPAWYTQPINLALIALAISVVVVASYWFKLKRAPLVER